MSYGIHEQNPTQELRAARLEYSQLPEQLKLLEQGVALYIQNNWPALKNTYTGKLEPVLTDGIGVERLAQDAAEIAIAEIVVENLASDVRRALNLILEGE